MARYLFASQNKRQKEKQKQEKGKRAYLNWAQLTEAARPRDSAVFFLAPGRLLPPWRACRRCLATSCYPRATYPRLDASWSHPDPFPLSSAISSPSFARFRRGQRSRRSAPPWTTWPPRPRAPPSKSIVFLVLDFVFTQKLEP